MSARPCDIPERQVSGRDKAYYGRRDLIIPVAGVTGALVALLAVVFAVRDIATGARTSPGELLFELAIAAAFLFGAIGLRADIYRGAADDGRLLVSFLARPTVQAIDRPASDRPRGVAGRFVGRDLKEARGRLSRALGELKHRTATPGPTGVLEVLE